MDDNTKKLLAAFMAKYKANKVPFRMRTQVKSETVLV